MVWPFLHLLTIKDSSAHLLGIATNMWQFLLANTCLECIQNHLHKIPFYIFVQIVGTADTHTPLRNIFPLHTSIGSTKQ